MTKVLNRFASVEQATQAKETLNGADIYTGCNTLKIEFSRVFAINLFLVILTGSNDDLHWVMSHLMIPLPHWTASVTLILGG